MNVTHLNIDAYFVDLQALKDSGGFTTVRTSSYEMNRDERGGVIDIRVVSGFSDEEHYYEFTSHCGEILAGDTNNEAVERAQKTIHRIGQKCEELGFRHGGGQWHQA